MLPGAAGGNVEELQPKLFVAYTSLEIVCAPLLLQKHVRWS
jgi:hypothetical protein